MAVYQTRAEVASQGDIFPAVPLRIPLEGLQGALKYDGEAIVVSHDCDCDKATGRAPGADPDSVLVTVAPVHLLTALSGGLPGDVRDGRVYRYFYLPPEGGYPEKCVDFALLQPMPVGTLTGRTRSASLSDDFRGRMQLHLRTLIERPPPPEGALP